MIWKDCQGRGGKQERSEGQTVSRPDDGLAERLRRFRGVSPHPGITLLAAGADQTGEIVRGSTLSLFWWYRDGAIGPTIKRREANMPKRYRVAHYKDTRYAVILIETNWIVAVCNSEEEAIAEAVRRDKLPRRF